MIEADESYSKRALGCTHAGREAPQRLVIELGMGVNMNSGQG